MRDDTTRNPSSVVPEAGGPAATEGSAEAEARHPALKGGDDVMLMPRTTAEVAAILAAANQERVAVFPCGLGTSLAGGLAKTRQGLVVSSQQFNRLVGIDSANLAATVEPGVLLADLQAAVERIGLFFPPDPLGEQTATMGSVIARNARGLRALKYGSAKDYILGLEAVLADGTILHTGARTVKNTSGYDLTRLLTGSRGTLAYITQATIRLLPLPVARILVVATFADLGAAAGTALSLLATKVIPAALELLDNTALRWLAVPSLGLTQDTPAALLVELDGGEKGVAYQNEVVAKVLKEGGADETGVFEEAGERSAILSAYRQALAALLGQGEPRRVHRLRASRAQLQPLLLEAKRLAAGANLPAAVVCHVGMGEVCLLLDRREKDAGEPGPAARLMAELRRLSALDGRPGGNDPRETGVALRLELMHRLKAAFDPRGILNPDGGPFAREGRS
ncbi:MAG: FAD-binding protein [Dehalococcoidales bacterium]|nr:FAD-binding protein [Dehalococcoidales bacterium]